MTTEVQIIPNDSEIKLIKESQKLIKTAYDERLLCNIIAKSISLPKDDPNVKVTIEDVLTILRKASSMHLDPVLQGLWAYKDKKGNLVCSVGKFGWLQILASQPNYFGIEHVHSEYKELRLHDNQGRQVIVHGFEECTCIIKKKFADGTVGEFKGTVFLRGEFNPSNPQWCSNTARMMMNRATAIAVQNAYGFGVYSDDEVRAYAESDSGTTINANTIDVTATTEKAKSGAQKTLLALENATTEKDILLTAIDNAISRDELEKVFKEAPSHLKSDEEIRTKAKDKANSFNNGENL